MLFVGRQERHIACMVLCCSKISLSFWVLFLELGVNDFASCFVFMKTMLTKSHGFSTQHSHDYCYCSVTVSCK